MAEKIDITLISIVHSEVRHGYCIAAHVASTGGLDVAAYVPGDHSARQYRGDNIIAARDFVDELKGPG